MRFKVSSAVNAFGSSKKKIHLFLSQINCPLLSYTQKYVPDTYFTVSKEIQWPLKITFLIKDGLD